MLHLEAGTCSSGVGLDCYQVQCYRQWCCLLNSYPDPSPRRYAGNNYLTSMHGYIQKPLLPGNFRAPSWPVVVKVPGVQFSGPVACGFEISVLHLGIYHHAYHLKAVSYQMHCLARGMTRANRLRRIISRVTSQYQQAQECFFLWQKNSHPTRPDYLIEKMIKGKRTCPC